MSAATGEVSNILAGLAKCPLCGGTMTRVNKGANNGVPYLVCVRAKSGGGCRYRQVRLGVIEGAIREKAAGIFARDMPAAADDLNTKLADLKGQQWALEEAIANLVREVQRGNPSRALRNQLTRDEKLLVGVERSLAEVEEAMGDNIRKSVLQRQDAVLDALQRHESTTTQINAALKGAFGSCRVDYLRGTLDFYWLHSERPTEVMFAWPEETT